MTKTLSMVRHKFLNLNANESFVMFLTSKFITCFIAGFTSEKKSQSIAYYSMGVNIYIGFWTLKWSAFNKGKRPSRKQGSAHARGVRLGASHAGVFLVLPLPVATVIGGI